jgi:hypothetical protein
MKKKDIEPLCKNCLLYDHTRGQCKVAVLVEGRNITFRCSRTTDVTWTSWVLKFNKYGGGSKTKRANPPPKGM